MDTGSTPVYSTLKALSFQGFFIFMTYPVSYYELPIEQHLQKVSVNTAEQVEPEFEERAPKM